MDELQDSNTACHHHKFNIANQEIGNMQYQNISIIIFLLLLHPLLCFTASTPSSPTNKGNKHELNNAIKNKNTAERKMQFKLSNLDDAMENEVFMGHTGHQKYVHLVGERKKVEYEAKVHHLASKIVLKNHSILPNIFHGRALEFDKKANHIQSEMDSTKANSKYDSDLFDKTVDEYDKELQDHDHAVARYNKIIFKHNRSHSH